MKRFPRQIRVAQSLKLAQALVPPFAALWLLFEDIFYLIFPPPHS